MQIPRLYYHQTGSLLKHLSSEPGTGSRSFSFRSLPMTSTESDVDSLSVLLLTT